MGRLGAALTKQDLQALTEVMAFHEGAPHEYCQFCAMLRLINEIQAESNAYAERLKMANKFGPEWPYLL